MTNFRVFHLVISSFLSLFYSKIRKTVFQAQNSTFSKKNESGSLRVYFERRILGICILERIRFRFRTTALLRTENILTNFRAFHCVISHFLSWFYSKIRKTVFQAQNSTFFQKNESWSLRVYFERVILGIWTLESIRFRLRITALLRT